MGEKNNRTKGIVGTIGFHLLALLAVLYFALSTPLPLPGEEGVEVNLGSSDQGMGQIQEQTPPPLEQPPVQLPPPQSDPEPEPEQDIITQDAEEAPAIQEEKVEKKDEVKQDEEVITPEEKVVEKEVVKDVKQDPEPQPEPPKVNERALYKGSTNTDGNGSNQGETGQPGDQGKPDGVPGSDNYTGSGKGNEGIGFDLAGRGAKHLAEPAYNIDEQGDVVVKVLVNRDGNVISVSIDRGTTITDPQLRQLALDAAKHSTFTPDQNAPDKQSGTITYHFRRLN